MPMHDLYSKRQKRIQGEVPEVFQYENFPEPFRWQVVYILRDVFGEPAPFSMFNKFFRTVYDILIREYGVEKLGQSNSNKYQEILEAFLIKCQACEKVLDIIELVFRDMNSVISGGGNEYDMLTSYNFSNDIIVISPDEAVAELNKRFLEHGLGYQFESNEIIRVDSKFIHSEVVKPALRVLADDIYKGANDEFLKAHEHYRHGRYKECLNECLKSFESTMKAICTKRSWTYSDKDTAKKLIDICLQEKLIPDYLQSQFTSLRSSLESGIPTLRNRTSGHGQGSEISEVPSYLASYLLHLTATTILLLTDAEKALD
jgi:AbiJ N-terminal domain 4